MTKTPAPQEQKENRVWIELDKPRDKAHADAVCVLANNFLQRIMPGTELRFFYSERKSLYCFGQVSFSYLIDRGTWLNLDHVGRPIDPDDFAAAAILTRSNAYVQEHLPLA